MKQKTPLQNKQNENVSSAPRSLSSQAPSQAPRQMAEFAPFILENVRRFKNREILIVGDVGIDEYVLGQVRRISPEAPVPVVEVETEEMRLGLSANVAQNVASLGGIPRLLSVVGDDASAEHLRRLLTHAEVNPEDLVVDHGRPTTRKLRVMVQNHHIVRVDYEQKQFLSTAVEDELLRRFAQKIDSASAVIIEDYAKGAVSERLIKEIIQMAHAKNKVVLADPHRSAPASTYRGVDLIKPNLEESYLLAGLPPDERRDDPRHLEQVAKKLMELVGCSHLVITRGKEGMRIFERDAYMDLPTNAKEVFDVTGAGDTVIAALALGWGAGFTIEQAAALANFAAGVVVGKVGCVPCSVAELEAAVKESM